MCAVHWWVHAKRFRFFILGGGGGERGFVSSMGYSREVGRLTLVHLLCALSSITQLQWL